MRRRYEGNPIALGLTKESHKALYLHVAQLVLIAQQRGEPRYTYVRNALENMGLDLGDRPEARVKDYIRRATDHKYLDEAGKGRGHVRKAGPNLERDTIRVRGGSATIEGSTGRVTIRDSEGKPVKGRRR
jgi:hypothetical protein